VRVIAAGAIFDGVRVRVRVRRVIARCVRDIARSRPARLARERQQDQPP